MSSVWVFSRGEDHEGSSIMGIYATKEKAMMEAKKYIQNYSSYNKWELVDDEDMSIVQWKSNCDNLIVEQWKVEE